MVNAFGIKRRGAAFDSMHNIAFAEQELGQIGAVLARGAGYESDFVRHDGFVYAITADGSLNQIGFVS
jgi:hypothetical protein